MKLPAVAPLFRPAAIAAAAFALAVGARADVTLAPLFRDGAIVQRNKPLPVWGQASPHERVQVQFRGETAETTANDAGRWRVTLGPRPASDRPADLVVTGRNVVRVRDVLVGDVWICSGQSNMGFSVQNVAHAGREILHGNHPLIREFAVARTVASAPADTCDGSWVTCRPDTVGNFTAVGYFFARDWQRRTGVPVGIVQTCWGGTPIESWMSAADLRDNPARGTVFARWQRWLSGQPARLATYNRELAAYRRITAADELKGKPFPHRPPHLPPDEDNSHRPSGLYNAMVHPLLPYAVRGIVWYQGETNGDLAPPLEYYALFPAMIREWRVDFAQGTLPFYFVQIANCIRPKDATGSRWAWLRDAQLHALALPATGMAVTIDIGNPHNIHPTDKQDVGRRLTLWARAQLLGDRVECSGPLFASARRDGGAMRVTFTHARGLRLKGGTPAGFEVAGSDHRFFPATARVDGDALVVSAAQVPAPVAVRYAWSNAPVACLFNAAGLPASPFRSDDWPPATNPPAL